jgi:mannose-6-phosphate isomerase
LLPVALPANRPVRFYRGGQLIDEFRREQSVAHDRPEDWVASTTTIHGEAVAGLSWVDGHLLRDAIAADPLGWLGKEHVERFGSDPALLVKLLAPEQRIPIHVHPDRDFAGRTLGSRWGKTEAWFVLDPGPTGDVWLGWRSHQTPDALNKRVASQLVDAMLADMNHLRLNSGDTVLVPAGTVHAIGAGMLLLELQEPSDLSIMLEWQGLDVGDSGGSLGLAWDVALAVVDLQAFSADRLATLVRRGSANGAGLLPAEARSFFRATRVTAADGLQDAGYAVLVAISGSGLIACEAGGSVPVNKGMTVVMPASTGPWQTTGDLALVACKPGALA